MWCDSFDCDLYKVVPEARAELAPVKDVVLFTHGSETGGKLNHPSAWHTDLGLTAFFGFNDGCGKPLFYDASSPVVRCTFEEAVRDLWVHNLVMRVEGHLVWNAHAEWPRFEKLMFDQRGWRKLDALGARRVRDQVHASIADAVLELQLLLARRG